jgi:hypothetical protein
MEISLHLGAHRTGTTSLQAYLGGYSQKLTQAGIAVLGPKRTRDGMFAGLVRDPDHVTPADDKLAKRSHGRIKIEAARAEMAGQSRLIISEENMIGTMTQNLRTMRLYTQARARLDRFAPAFEGQRLRIAVSIRSYEFYWASALAFKIKGGMGLPDAALLDCLVTQPRRWADLVRDIRAVFPDADVVVWPFEACIGQPKRQLEALLGEAAPAHLGPGGDIHNASAKPHMLAQIIADQGDAEGAARVAQMAGRYMPFDDYHIEKLQDDYRADLDWLKAGADGLADYLDPTEGTFGGLTDGKGSSNERSEERLASTG